MQPRETIRVVVQEDGQVKTDFTHFSGEACLIAGRRMQTLLSSFGIQMQQTAFIPKPELLTVKQQEGVVATEEMEQFDAKQ